MKLFSLRTKILLKGVSKSMAKDIDKASWKYKRKNNKRKFVKGCIDDSLQTSSTFVNDIFKWL